MRTSATSMICTRVNDPGEEEDLEIQRQVTATGAGETGPRV